MPIYHSENPRALKNYARSSHCGSVGWEPNCTGLGCCGDAGLIPGPAQQARGPSVATAAAQVTAAAQIQSLSWEFPHAMGVTITGKKRKKRIMLNKSSGGLAVEGSGIATAEVLV